MAAMWVELNRVAPIPATAEKENDCRASVTGLVTVWFEEVKRELDVSGMFVHYHSVRLELFVATGVLLHQSQRGRNEECHHGFFARLK